MRSWILALAIVVLPGLLFGWLLIGFFEHCHAHPQFLPFVGEECK